ncbi:MAG: glycosyltransferase [Christensenellaceae bacterium]|nr:glycosyltransferase [Christensenellaceae bacterium]
MIKVLQVLDSLGFGGAERMILNLIEHLDPTEIQTDFVVNGAKITPLEQIVISNGHKVFHNSPIKEVGFSKNFEFLKRVMQDNGPYNIVHSHIDYLGGGVALAAKKTGVPIRISHSHNTRFANIENSNLNKMLFFAFRFLMNKYSTKKIACGHDAALALFGKRGAHNSLILNNSIDVEKFAQNISQSDKINLKSKTNLPPDSFVLGHIGRFVEAKNHIKIIDVFNELLKTKSNSFLILIGDGILKERIMQKVASLNINDKVMFLGNRQDICSLLKVMDLFIMPSTFEGLPVSLIEAQAASVPCLISDSIDRRVDLFNTIKFISIDESDGKWASLCMSSFSEYPNTNERKNKLKELGYDTTSNVNVLKDLYGIVN